MNQEIKSMKKIKKKKKYGVLEFEIILFGGEDLITTSCTPDYDDCLCDESTGTSDT